MTYEWYKNDIPATYDQYANNMQVLTNDMQNDEQTEMTTCHLAYLCFFLVNLQNELSVKEKL